MTLTRRGRIVAYLATALAAIPLALLGSLDADAWPAPDTGTAPNEREWRCHDKAARILYRAGFTGEAHRQAWAVTWRESRHQNLIPGHPQFNGADWGMWQINRPAWGDQPWWTEANMSDPRKQSRIAYRILTKKGTYWRPWGLTADGQLDPTHYQSWGPDLWEAWIMAPFRQGLAKYPCKTTPPQKDKR